MKTFSFIEIRNGKIIVGNNRSGPLKNGKQEQEVHTLKQAIWSLKNDLPNSLIKITSYKLDKLEKF